MLFDLFDIPREKAFKHWVERVHFVASVLQYDYFKLWELPEHEFVMLEDFAYKEIEFRKNQREQLINDHNNK